MAKSPIVAAIEEQERLAVGHGNLQEERQDALDRYLGRPYGDEEEGRSAIVMRDVADTIEWIKPSLLKVFCSGDEVVKFEPIGPEDEEQAEQETDYCNHIVMQKNNGFLIFHDWFHDALLQKNGYVMGQFEVEERPTTERYQGLTDDEFALIAQNPEVEIVEHTATVDDLTGMIYHDLAVKCVKEYGCIKITNIPPERVLVASDWSGLDFDGCPFLEVIDYKTISQLRQEGYEVDDDISDNSAYNEDRWEEQRREVSFDGTIDREDIEADPATRRVRVRYVWVRYDEDGDGIAELRRVVLVGTTELENEEDDLIPVASLTPCRMPHEHYGLSIADVVSDLQRIRTTLVRGFLDNMYLANNGRYAIDADRVNLDDMLVARPGGLVRVKGGVDGAIFPLVHPQSGGDILSAVEYVDTVRENRTGVTKYNQGLDANSLNKTATGVSQIMSAAQQRIELIARILAETGVKNLMLIVHALSLKNTRQQEMVKLRNKWVPVDPRTWKIRKDLSVSVGLGTGNKDQMLSHLMMILQAQREGFQIGVATPKNIYNALKKLTQNAGFKNEEEFWTDPETQQPQEEGPSPEEQKMQAEMQMKGAELQMKQEESQFNLAAKQQEAQIGLQKAQVELQIKLAELELKKQDLEIKRESAILDAQIAQQRAVMLASDDMARAQEINNR